jgi:hypothetical protein
LPPADAGTSEVVAFGAHCNPSSVPPSLTYYNRPAPFLGVVKV